MAKKDYSHRDVLDKLGIKAGFAVAFDETAAPIPAELKARVRARVGRDAAREEEPVDAVVVATPAATDVEAVLEYWRARIEQAGGIWLLTPKRGQPGYVDQAELIPAGLAARLVDNKTCSVSDTLSGIRFVIRKIDRVYS